LSLTHAFCHESMSTPQSNISQVLYFRTDPYRDRVLASTGRDPLRCTRCGGEMMLWKVWHPRYGVIYSELYEIKRGRYGPRRAIPPDVRANGDGEKPMLQLALTGLRV